MQLNEAQSHIMATRPASCWLWPVSLNNGKSLEWRSGALSAVLMTVGQLAVLGGGWS